MPRGVPYIGLVRCGNCKRKFDLFAPMGIDEEVGHECPHCSEPEVRPYEEKKRKKKEE